MFSCCTGTREAVVVCQSHHAVVSDTQKAARQGSFPVDPSMLTPEGGDVTHTTFWEEDQMMLANEQKKKNVTSGSSSSAEESPASSNNDSPSPPPDGLTRSPTTDDSKQQRLTSIRSDDSEDLNADQGLRNPPLYQNPERSVQAKKEWLQKAFSPAGTDQFRVHPSSSSKHNNSNNNNDRSWIRRPSNEKVLSEKDAERENSTNSFTKPKEEREERLLHTAPSPPTEAYVLPHKPLPVREYKDCFSNNNNDESFYEAWYQHGLLRWRPRKYQPVDATGSYHHGVSMKNVNADDDDDDDQAEEEDKQQTVHKPESPERLSTRNLYVMASPSNPDDSDDSSYDSSLADIFAASSGTPTSIYTSGGEAKEPSPVATREEEEEEQVKKESAAKKEESTDRRISHEAESSRDPDGSYNRSASQSSMQPTPNPKRAEFHALSPSLQSLSRQSGLHRSRAVPIVSLFGSPTPNNNNNNKRVAHYQTYVASYKTYVGDRTSPEHKETHDAALEQLQATKENNVLS